LVIIAALIARAIALLARLIAALLVVVAALIARTIVALLTRTIAPALVVTARFAVATEPFVAITAVIVAMGRAIRTLYAYTLARLTFAHRRCVLCGSLLLSVFMVLCALLGITLNLVLGIHNCSCLLCQCLLCWPHGLTLVNEIDV